MLKSAGCAEKTDDAGWRSTRAGQDPRSAATILARRARSRNNGEFKLGVEKDGKYDVKMDQLEKGSYAIRTVISQFREYKRRRGTVPTRYQATLRPLIDAISTEVARSRHV